MPKHNREVHILLVEDSLEDAQLTKYAFKRAKIPHTLTIVNDGLECMTFLRGQEEYKDRILPDLILLDLNMPRKGGKEVLEEIKTDQELKSIPVIVLTTSQSKEDVKESYERYANGYVSKPIDFNEFSRVVSVIDSFWLNLVSLPHPPKSE